MSHTAMPTNQSTILKHSVLWVPPALYGALIFYFSSQSFPLEPVTTHVWDKALHGTEYAGLAFLLCRAFRGEGMSPRSSVAWAMIAASLYAASDEWHQSFVPWRDSNALDWVADTLGGAVGATVYLLGSRTAR